jgi:hypothetical protein
MRTLRLPAALLAACIAALAGAPARAGSLVTPPLVVTSGEILYCALRNVGSKDLREVSLEVSDTTGVLDTTGAAVVPPGSGVEHPYTDNATTTKVCRFTFKGPRKGAVGSACVLPAPFSSCQTSVPAQ